MRFEGRVWKDGNHWLIEIPALEATTQGRTKKEAFAMIKDLLETMAAAPGLEVEVEPLSGDRFEVTTSWTGHSGRPTPLEECEGLLETLDILADPVMSEAVRRGLQEVAEGDLVSHETLWNESDDQVRG